MPLAGILAAAAADVVRQCHNLIESWGHHHGWIKFDHQLLLSSV